MNTRPWTVGLLLLCPLTLSAATRTWDGGSASSANWTDDENWFGNVPPSAGDFLVFPAGAARLTNTNTFSPNTVFGGIIIQGDNYNIYGNAVTITNHVTAEAGASGNVFRPDIRLGAPSYFRALGSGLQLTFRGDIDLNGYDLTLLSQAELVCDGAIGGTGDVATTGSGRVVFSGSQANTYTGNTTVYGGILELRKYGLRFPSGARIPRIAIPGNLQIGLSTSSLISDAAVLEMFGQLDTNAQVRVNATGELNLNGYSETILFLRLDGGHVTTGSGELTVWGAMLCEPDDDGSVISGHLNLGHSATYLTVDQNATLAVFASVSGEPSGLLTKQGAGELALNSSNSYAGRIVLADGTLRAAANGALGSGTNEIRLTGGRLVLENATITGKPLTVEKPGDFGSRGASCAWHGAITLDAFLTVEVDSGNLLTFGGAISGPGDLIKSGLGRLALTGSSANSFDDTRASEGQLLLGKTPNQDAVPDTLSVGDDLGTPLTVVVRLNAAHQIGDASLLLLNRSAWLDLNGRNETIGALAGSGQVSLGAGQLTVAGPYGSDFDGVITGTGGLASLVGEGIFTLRGQCPYSGDTTVQGGFAVNGSLSNSAVTVAASGRLYGIGRVHSITVNAGGVLTPGPGPAILESLGSVAIRGGTNRVQIQGPRAGTGYDQLRAGAGVTLNGAVLELYPAFDLPDGAALRIVNKTSAGPISGTFAGLAEGAVFTVSNRVFSISYRGGDGNDVVLTAHQPPRLAIARGATNAVVVSWPAPADGWLLERTNVLADAAGPWTPVPPPYQSQSGVIFVDFTNTPPVGNQFFRLHKP